MKYSLNWLKEHLDGGLPATDSLVSEVTLRAFEVEETEAHGDDTVMEIKVLPDRAHDALSHRGMAREIGGLLGVSRKERAAKKPARDASVPRVRVAISEPELCMRYIATRVDGVTIGAAPKEIAAKLAAIGGRSINNIVDITNFVLFDIGQPLHAFDADKVKGGITVRLAKEGETMTTLDNKELLLDGSELVIADDEAVLALAGVKGGKKAEVDEDTKSIILECANFDPTLTRKTAQKTNVKTDASKRYENGITSSFAMEGCELALSLIAEFGGKSVRIGETTDVYPTPESPVTATVSVRDVNRLLGLSLSLGDVARLLAEAHLVATEKEGTFTVSIPPERLDLRIKEDLVEEIGRHHGYAHVASVVPKLAKAGLPNKRLYYANKARRSLLERGYSEVFTYSFAKAGNGEIEVLYPVGKDRPFVRKDLIVGIEESLKSNLYNAPLIGIEEARVFEIGNVFPLSGERMKLAIGIGPASKGRAKEVATEAKTTIVELARALGAKEEPKMTIPDIEPEGILKWSPAVVEIDLDSLIETLPEPSAYEPLRKEDETMRYRSLSSFPFIVRDIAIFVPEAVEESHIEALLRREAGELVVRFSRFDRFQKPGEDRVSYGFRMVFQSFERTLTDEEVGRIMERVTAKANAEKGWEVR